MKFYSRSEEKRRGLESELKLLLEENCDLFSKIKQLEDMHHETNLNCGIRECQVSCWIDFEFKFQTKLGRMIEAIPVQ